MSQGADLILFALPSPKAFGFWLAFTPSSFSLCPQLPRAAPCHEHHHQPSPLHRPVLSLSGGNREHSQRVTETGHLEGWPQKGSQLGTKHPELWQGFISSTTAWRDKALVRVFGSVARRGAQLLLAPVARWHMQSFFHFISAGGSCDFPCRLSGP